MINFLNIITALNENGDELSALKILCTEALGASSRQNSLRKLGRRIV